MLPLVLAQSSHPGCAFLHVLTITPHADEWLIGQPGSPRFLDRPRSRITSLRQSSVQALLRSCRPVAVDEQHVVLETCYSFHRDRLEGDDVRGVVEQALAAMIGEPVTLQVVLAEKGLASVLP